MTQHTNALSKLQFGNEKVGNHENAEDQILHWLEIDILLQNGHRIETRQDPILNKILERLKRIIRNNCSMVERTFKEKKHKLIIERGIICNGDIIVPPETLRKDTSKSIYDDVYYVIRATPRRFKWQAWRPGYLQEVENYIKRCPKCTEIKKF